MHFATLRGVFLGAIAGLGLGGLTAAVCAVRGTLAVSDGVDTFDKSRRLGEAISEGMHLGLLIGVLASIVAIPLAIGWSRRRALSRARTQCCR